MKYKDIVLIAPVMRRNLPYLPLGLLYLSSFLEASGISTSVIHFTIELRNSSLYLARRIAKRNAGDVFFRKAIIEEIRARQPVIAGLSCYTVEYPWVMEMAREIKEETGVPVVVGGVHATLRPGDFIFKGSPVDYAVIGEGETPLTQLVNALKNRSPLLPLSHIAYLQEDGRPVNGTCNIEQDISDFPMPDYSKVDMRYFTRPMLSHVRNIALSGIEIFTSRGCPYNCDFCANNYLWPAAGSKRTVRYRDIGCVIEELEFLVSAYGIDGFYILDDCFLLSEDRTAGFCQKLLKAGLGLVWGAETRVDLVNNGALLKLMQRSGLLQLDFGVESGSPAMLEEIHKGITVEQTRRAFALCRENGIRTFANIMFNMPRETEKDICLTEQLLDEIKPTVVSMMPMIPFLGTKAYEKYISPEISPSEYGIFNNIASDTLDTRFLLAAHRLDFTRLILRLGKKFAKMERFICLSPLYWKKILRSRHFLGYLLMLFLAPVDMLIGCCRRLDAAVFNNMFKGMARKFIGLPFKSAASAQGGARR